jgi:hypothetical protein
MAVITRFSSPINAYGPISTAFPDHEHHCSIPFRSLPPS